MDKQVLIGIILFSFFLTTEVCMAEHKHIRDYDPKTKSGKGTLVIIQDYDSKNPPKRKEGFYSRCKICGEEFEDSQWHLELIDKEIR